MGLAAAHDQQDVGVVVVGERALGLGRALDRGLVDLEGLWCSGDPTDTATLPEGSDAVEARLVDVAIRCALRSDAEVHFVPRHGGPAEGIGAILRW